ncbi:CopG family transcriptional regulator [Sphingosinicella sp. BN140058]|uniref:CopG family transcriptional regulator n=1 Tax=Sphingosinicella sp. BN140058 TaxID=1892855 RepID=UPI0010139C51|nr:CopG family transcriptional regulator [Sphingosinicella sp. BN140058]QAY75098.1 CopG family transcriptional regulator [Sphingosinicella sp. BN140058]
MASEKVVPLRGKVPDSEKITINLGFVDLGQIDLLVQDGFYSNRSDFIRTAIRNQLERHGEEVRKSVRRKQLDLGLSRIDSAELQRIKAAGETLELQVLGLLSIAEDVSPELARETIGSLQVLGALHASAAVKAALADRMR